jgi:hypothetical protein
VVTIRRGYQLNMAIPRNGRCARTILYSWSTKQLLDNGKSIAGLTTGGFGRAVGAERPDCRLKADSVMRVLYWLAV